MQPLTWSRLPIWALVADREILRAAIPERRLAETLNDMLAVVTGVAEFDLAPAAAIYLRDEDSSSLRLFHLRQADDTPLPMELTTADSEQTRAVRGRGLRYRLPLVRKADGQAFGAVLLHGRTGRRMSAEKLSILSLLCDELSHTIQHRHGTGWTLMDLVELSSDEIYVFDPRSLKIARTNGTACLRTGHGSSALMQMTTVELKADIGEEDYRSRIAPLLRGEADRISFDAKQKRRNGTIYPVTVQVWRIGGADQEIFAEIATSSSNQLRSFGLLEQVFEAIPDGIGVFDHRSRLMMANRKLYDLIDIPPERFPPGTQFEDILRYNAELGEYGDGDREAMVRDGIVLVGMGLPYSLERERTSGKVVAMRSEPLSNGGYVLSYTDVTQRRRVEQEMLRNQDELEATVRQRTAEITAQAAALEDALQQEKNINAMQRQFVAMTSHEFRTPLAIIDGAAQRLQRKKDLEQRFLSEKTQQIRASVSRMVQLMESFLSAGRMEAGRVELSLVECSLPKLVEQAVKRQKLSATHHRFETDLGGLPNLVCCDALAISQVMSNLLSNAVKYAPRAPEISIKGWQKGNRAFVSVSDEGIGIDSDDIPKLFQPYFRGRTSTGIAGTGIGLSLVKQIIDLHEGEILVESRRGKGTTFTMILPLAGPQFQTEQEAATVSAA